MLRNMSFNQSNTALAVATKIGFSLYNLSEIDTTVRETHRDTKEKLKIEQSAKADDIFLIERHYEQSIVAVVPVTKRRTLVLWDFGKGQSFPEKDKNAEITVVKFYKRNIIVFTEFDIMMHSIDRLTFWDHHKLFKITSNPEGIHAVAYAAIDKTMSSRKCKESREICLIAVPYKKEDGEDGQITMFDVQHWRSYGVGKLHSTPVEALALNASGTLLTSACRSGEKRNSVVRVFTLQTHKYHVRGKPKWGFTAIEKFEFRRDIIDSASILSLSFSNCSNFITANTNGREVLVYSLDEDVTNRKTGKIIVKGLREQRKRKKKKEEEEEEKDTKCTVDPKCWLTCYTKCMEEDIEENFLNKICAITTMKDQLRVVIVTSDLCLSVYTIPSSTNDKFLCLGYYDLRSKDPNYSTYMPIDIIKGRLFNYSIYEATAMHNYSLQRQQEDEERGVKKKKRGSFRRTIQFSDEVLERDTSLLDVTASTSAAAAAQAAAVKDAAAYEDAAKAAAFAAGKDIASVVVTAAGTRAAPDIDASSDIEVAPDIDAAPAAANAAAIAAAMDIPSAVVTAADIRAASTAAIAAAMDITSAVVTAADIHTAPDTDASPDIDAAPAAFIPMSISLPAISANQPGSARKLHAAVTAAQKREWLSKGSQTKPKTP